MQGMEIDSATDTKLPKDEVTDSAADLKRPKEEDVEDGEIVPRKKKIKVGSYVKKSPVMILHEMNPDLDYIIEERGPPHSRVFSATISVNNETYTAEGTSKKAAKANAAAIALQCFIQLENPTVNYHLTTGSESSQTDFSSDPVEIFDQDSDSFFYTEAAVTKVVQESFINNSCKVHPTSTAIYQLNRLRQGLKFEIVNEEGKDHQKKFTAQGIYFVIQLKIISVFSRFTLFFVIYSLY